MNGRGRIVFEAGEAGFGSCAQSGIDQIFFAKIFVEGDAFVFVLGGHGAAAEEVAGFAAEGVAHDAFPEHVEDGGVAVVGMDAGAAEFEDFGTDFFERSEVEKLFAVITEIAFCAKAALHAIGADEFSGSGVANEKMVADEIELIAVELSFGGAFEAFAEFAIENEIAEALAIEQVFERFGHAGAKLSC